MSLKAFHIFFIAISAILMTGLGVWSLAQYLYAGAGNLYLVLGPLSLLASASLIFYGQRFLKKMKGISYL